MSMTETLALLYAREVLKQLNRQPVFVYMLPESSRNAVFNALEVVAKDLGARGYGTTI